MSRRSVFLAILPAALAGAIVWSACGSSGSGGLQSQPATTLVTVSDPATCSASAGGGPYTQVWVTITDVKASTNSTGDSGFVDLTPGLQPTQVDLLGQADNQCFLASLGSTTALSAGDYQQIRVQLAADSQAGAITGNHCGNAANCLVLSADGSVQPIMLTSEAQTGLKIPSGQIAGGKFTVTAGQTKDLDIDFDACASIVAAGSGKFLLKPVLHAGEVTTSSSSISGTVLADGGAPIVGGKVLVALESKDESGVDRISMEQTVTDASGNFIFCPVAVGSYDVVAVAVDKNDIAYAATITTGVANGSALGNVPLFPLTAAPVTVSGTVASSATGGGAVAAMGTISALQKVTIDSTAAEFTIPLAEQTVATQSFTTAASSSCPAGTDCAPYTLDLPAITATVAAFNAGGTTYTAPVASTSADYSVEAQSSAENPCSPAAVQAPISVSITVPNLAGPELDLKGCPAAP